MATWLSRGLRGSILEELIDFTNTKYREKNIALIQKIPTPIKPINIDKASRHITLAYFEKKSTVDYMGVVQGVPVCFDAKECSKNTFSLRNIHKHQIEFMQEFENQNGLAFILLYYTHINEFYYLSFKQILEFYNRSLNGGRKSFTIDEIDKSTRINSYKGVPVHYLEEIKKDLESRDWHYT